MRHKINLDQFNIQTYELFGTHSPYQLQKKTGLSNMYWYNIFRGHSIEDSTLDKLYSMRYAPSIIYTIYEE